ARYKLPSVRTGTRSDKPGSGGGGRAGIRTQGALPRPTVFKTAPFDRSGTPPEPIIVVRGRAEFSGSEPLTPLRPAHMPGVEVSARRHRLRSSEPQSLTAPRHPFWLCAGADARPI